MAITHCSVVVPSVHRHLPHLLNNLTNFDETSPGVNYSKLFKEFHAELWLLWQLKEKS